MPQNVSEETQAIESVVTQPAPDEALLSPSLQTSSKASAHAYEMKFLLPEEAARQLQSWAAAHLNVDAYANPEQGNSYQTTTLYLDTVPLDLFHQPQKFRGRKYRLRRYGQEENIYLERKRRRGDRVRKRRHCVQEDELVLLETRQQCPGQPEEWFHRKVARHELRPSCCVTYERAAFMKRGITGPMRLTFDRRIRGVRADDWSVSPVTDGTQILAGEVICEFKFRESVPALFQQIIEAMQLQPASVSKYRRLMQAILNPNDSGLEGVARHV